MNNEPPIRAGVIGWPVSHSLSPRLHGFWLETLGISGTYEAIPVEPENLERDIRGLIDRGYAGINATLPHKEALVSLVDRIEPFAKRVGAVNTLVFEGGTIIAGNTDGFGFIENLRQGAGDDDFTGRPAVVLGAGGAARAVIAALQDAGVPEIRLTNRTKARAEELAADLDRPDFGAIAVVDWSARDEALADAGLVANTSSLGMTGQPPLEVGLDDLPGDALVTDIVYNPLETDLLARAKARGNPVVDGLGMLLHQARPGFESWFGRAPTVTPELRAHVLAGLSGT